MKKKEIEEIYVSCENDYTDTFERLHEYDGTLKSLESMYGDKEDIPQNLKIYKLVLVSYVDINLVKV